MPSCVFDIETAALPETEIPPALVQRLQEADPEDDAWKEMLGLYSLSAQVICIGMLNPDSGRGELLYDDRHGDLDKLEFPEGTEFSLFGGDETAILERFWQSISRYRPVITYNGRGFDVPFLMQRSLIREVEITENLLPPRFYLNRANHLDLQDILSTFRATRPYGLAAWTQAIGASSPKEGSVAGAEVGEAFHAGRTGEIVEYCARDVVATAKLADRVLRHWAAFIHS
jgi:DNA polymerase elongation subunit (family B)